MKKAGFFVILLAGVTAFAGGTDIGSSNGSESAILQVRDRNGNVVEVLKSEVDSAMKELMLQTSLIRADKTIMNADGSIALINPKYVSSTGQVFAVENEGRSGVCLALGKTVHDKVEVGGGIIESGGQLCDRVIRTDEKMLTAKFYGQTVFGGENTYVRFGTKDCTVTKITCK